MMVLVSQRRNTSRWVIDEMSLTSVLPALPGVYTQKSNAKQKLVVKHCMMIWLQTLNIDVYFPKQGPEANLRKNWV